VTAQAVNAAEVNDEACTFVGQPRLEIVKTGPEKAYLGSEVTYGIEIRNVGDMAAQDVVVTDMLPAGLVHASGQQVLTENIGDLAPGAVKKLAVDTKASQLGTVCNPAKAEASDTDAVEAEACTFIGEPRLEIVKTGPERAYLGTEVTYGIQISNTGDMIARNVVVTDALPAGLVHASGTQVLAEDMGDLLPGASKEFRLTVTANQTGKICNPALAQSIDTADVMTEACTLVGEPKLEIVKNGPKQAYLGSEVSYGIEVRNTGSMVARDVVVTDMLPAGLVHESGAQAVTKNIGDLAPGTVTAFKLTAKASQTGEVCNPAVATSPDTEEVRDEACTFIGQPKLEIAKTGPAKAYLGTDVTYNIEVRNTGSMLAHDVVVTDMLPAALVHASGKQEATTLVGDLAPGVVKRIRVVAKASQTGEVCNPATARAVGTAEVKDQACTFIGQPRLEIAKTGPAKAYLGTELTYAIEVRNTGDMVAHDVIVTDMLPAALVHDSGKQKVAEHIGDLAPGAVKKLAVTARASQTGDVCNPVVAQSSDAGDVEAKACTFIGQPRLEIAKTGPAKAYLGTDVIYDIRVSNTGSMTARNVVVTDTLPAGLVHASGDQVITRNIGDLAPGAVTALSVTAKTSQNGTICNPAVAQSTDTGEVKAEACTFIGQPQLAIAKTGPKRARLGHDVSYGIVVRNIGDMVARDVVVTDVLPAGLVHASGAQEITENVGDLAPGAVKKLAIIAKASQTGTVCNPVVAKSTDTNEVKAEACTFVGEPKLELAKTGTKTAMIGSRAVYQIVVSNPGSEGLANVIVSDIAPAGTRIISAPEATVEGNKATWQLDRLDAGATKTLRMLLTGVRIGTLCNLASANAAAAGLDANAKACTDWKGQAALLIEMIDDPDPILIDDATRYTVLVTNQGTEDDTNVQIVAHFSAEIDPTSTQGHTAGTINGKEVTFAPVAVLKPKETATWTIDAKGVATGDHRLRVLLTSDLLTTPVPEEESTHVY
jgi:uncharacterized repeat protein (TIGR01451 family)